ncbi:MAG: MYXO-CTERM sorting domain-containing protein [Candidatus Binatia bacterium]
MPTRTITTPTPTSPPTATGRRPPPHRSPDPHRQRHRHRDAALHGGRRLPAGRSRRRRAGQPRRRRRGADRRQRSRRDAEHPAPAGRRRPSTCRAGAASGKQARGRVEGDTARVLVLALDEVTPIGDQAELYQCTLRVAPDAPTGHYPIACASAGASDAGGGAIPIGCRDGELVVADPQPASPTAPHGATGDAGAELSRAEDSGGCAIGPTATPSGGALLIWAALLACARRRRSRGR